VLKDCKLPKRFVAERTFHALIDHEYIQKLKVAYQDASCELFEGIPSEAEGVCIFLLAAGERGVV